MEVAGESTVRPLPLHWCCKEYNYKVSKVDKFHVSAMSQTDTCDECRARLVLLSFVLFHSCSHFLLVRLSAFPGASRPYIIRMVAERGNSGRARRSSCTAGHHFESRSDDDSKGACRIWSEFRRAHGEAGDERSEKQKDR